MQHAYNLANQRLVAAQSRLAAYDLSRTSTDFLELWNSCETALKEIWQLREQMAAHVATHEDCVLESALG